MASCGNACRITCLNEENLHNEDNLVLNALLIAIFLKRSWTHEHCQRSLETDKGYENHYGVINLGNVLNDKTHRILQGDCNTVGYIRAILYVPVKKRFFVHRLVAYHFVSSFHMNLLSIIKMATKWQIIKLIVQRW